MKPLKPDGDEFSAPDLILRSRAEHGADRMTIGLSATTKKCYHPR